MISSITVWTKILYPHILMLFNLGQGLQRRLFCIQEWGLTPRASYAGWEEFQPVPAGVHQGPQRKKPILWLALLFTYHEIVDVHQMTPDRTQRIRHKSTLYVHLVGPWVPSFHTFCSIIIHFQDIAHFRIFPLTPMLKFQSATKFLTLADC